jgi:4-carboxymuconolactone decarboxylase
MTSKTTKIPAAIEARMAAREAEILGHPPRLTPLSDTEFGDDAHEWVRANSAAMNNLKDEQPPISATFRTFFRNFPLFRAQMSVYAQLLANSKLSARDREISIMRMLWLCNSPHPYGEHVKIARQIGMTQQELIAVLEGPDSPVWTDNHDRTVLRAVDELYRHQSMTNETWGKLAAVWNDAQLFEFISCVVQYYGSACLHNVIRTRPAETNMAYRELESGE